MAAPNFGAFTDTTGSHSLADGAFSAVPLDNEGLKVGVTHDTVTNNSRVTVPGAGYYDLYGQVLFTDTQGAGLLKIAIVKNGVSGTPLRQNQFYMRAARVGVVISLDVHSVELVAASDYFEIYVGWTATTGGQTAKYGSSTAHLYSYLSLFQVA